MWNRGSAVSGGAGRRRAHERAGGGDPAAPQRSRTPRPDPPRIRRPNDQIMAGAEINNN